MRADGSFAVCELCLDDADECPRCDEPGCTKHAVVFGFDDGYCLEHRDPCLSCNEPVAKGARLCEPCRLDEIADQLAHADTLPPAALEVA